MNKYYTEFKQPFGNGSRDPIFQRVENELLEDKPAKILEIGSIRDPNSKDGDGWSTFYWAEHVEKYGGKIVVCDIDPLAIQTAKEMLSDFIEKIDIQFVVDDGINWIQKEEWDLVFLDGADDPNHMYEQYKKINRTKTHILCDDFHGKGVRLQQDYVDFVLLPCNHIHLMAMYPKVVGNDLSTKVGLVEINYIRETPNNSWRNERSIELGLGEWFVNKFNNKIIEIGDVCPHYSIYQKWDCLDPYGPFKNAIRKDVMEMSYAGLNCLSLSTFEHFAETEYGNVDKEKPIKALEKLHAESPNYLITIPIGADRNLENYIKNQAKIKYTFMVRNSKRGEVNNWHQSNDINLFDENYLHFDYKLGYYGSAYAICIITNQTELL